MMQHRLPEPLELTETRAISVQLEELRAEQGKMAHEKEVLENQLEAEQEYIVHKLQKQAAHIAAERQALQLEKGDLKRQVQTPDQHSTAQCSKQLTEHVSSVRSCPVFLKQCAINPGSC